MADFILYSETDAWIPLDARNIPLQQQNYYIYLLAVANEALKRAGGDPFCLRPAPVAGYRTCWYNAILNREGTFRDAGLRMAIGGLTANGVSIYGHPNPADKRYAKKPNDSHAWLVDAYGRIYDHIHAGVTLVVQLSQKVPTFPEGEIRGETPEALAAKGLVYTEFTEENLHPFVDWLRCGSPWIPVDITVGFRTRTEGDEARQPWNPPWGRLAVDRTRIALKSEVIDDSWREILKRDPREAFRAARATEFIR
jgi:hypothetical protein